MNYDMREERKAAKPVRSASHAVKCCLTAAGLAAAFALSASAGAKQPDPSITLGLLVQVTGDDPFGPGSGPFSNCTADHVDQQENAFGSIVYPNTSIEPWVAVRPSDSLLVMGHHQDRWDDGGARGLPGRVSADGGSTWKDTIPPGVTECTGGMFGRGSDPWLDFSPHGTAFFMSLVLDAAQPFSPFGARNSAVLVSRSSDGAQTWGAPTTLIHTQTQHALNDKTSLTADRTNAGFVYAVWDQLSIFPKNGSTAGDQLLAENDGVVIARDLLDSTVGGSPVCAPFFTPPCKGGAPFLAGGTGVNFDFTGPTFLARTKDDGNSWSTGSPIFQPGNNAQTINNIVVVLPPKLGETAGDLLDFFTGINVTPSGLSIDYIRSTDSGATWSGLPATPPADIDVVGVVTPDSGGPIRDASILFAVAVDPSSGNLYLAWQDDRVSLAAKTTCTTPTGTIPIDGIVFSQSTDGGKTWSSPVQINDTPANATNPCRQQAFIPAIVVAGDGTVVVTYYDFRNDTDTNTNGTGVEGTDYFVQVCKPGTTPGTQCSIATNWGKSQQLTTSSFNILDAPVARGHFLGDYMGLAASGAKNVFPVFGIATGHNLTADFTREITLP